MDVDSAPHWRSAFSVAAIATVAIVLIRLWFAHGMKGCGVPDSCAYLGLAESLAKHHGFTERFLFDFQLDHVDFPTHGIEYWRPGTSFFLLLGRPFGGVTLLSSLVITILIGILLASAAWRIAMNFTGDRTVASTSYILCLTLPPLWDSSMIPDSGLFYAAFVAWFLALFTARFQGYGRDALALLCLAIAYLIRNDAVLLAIPFAVVLLLRLRGLKGKGCSLPYCALLCAGFLAALAPMHLIYAGVLGTAFPSGSSKVLYMDDLGDFNRYGSIVTRHTWLATGIGHLIKQRIAVFPLILYRIFFIVIGFGAIFLPLLALRRQDGRRVAVPESSGSVAFALTIILVYSAILPAIGVFSALRTSMGLLPFVAVCIVIAMRAACGSAKMAGGLTISVCFFYTVTGVMADRRVSAGSAEAAAKTHLVGSFLAAHHAAPEGATVIMTADPVQFSEATSFAAISLPTNGADAVRRASADFHVTHVLVEATESPETLAELTAALHPAQVSTVPGTNTVVLTLPAAMASK